MPTAIYPGSFDPVTFGHIDIAQRASQIFEKVVAVIADNPNKNCLFSVEERLYMVQKSLENLKNVKVVKDSGLVVDCVEKYKASVIIRGLRALSDFDYEFQMAFTNRELNSRADTVFLMPSAEYTYLSSTMIRQIAMLKGDVSSFVPACVEENLKKKFE